MCIDSEGSKWRLGRTGWCKCAYSSGVKQKSERVGKVNMLLFRSVRGKIISFHGAVENNCPGSHRGCPTNILFPAQEHSAHTDWLTD